MPWIPVCSLSVPHNLLSVYYKHIFQVCGSKGKQQHKAAVSIIAKLLVQKKGAFLPASKMEEEDVVTIDIRMQR